MPELTAEQKAHMESLRQAFRAQLPKKVRSVVAAAVTLGPGDWDPERLRALFLLTHSLTGSSAIYGFAKVSQAAAALERFLGAALADELPPGSVSELERLVAALAREVPVEIAAGDGTTSGS
jgi:chemotaxis protein histidine kinase CheA